MKIYGFRNINLFLYIMIHKKKDLDLLFNLWMQCVFLTCPTLCCSSVHSAIASRSEKNKNKIKSQRIQYTIKIVRKMLITWTSSGALPKEPKCSNSGRLKIYINFGGCFGFLSNKVIILLTLRLKTLQLLKKVKEIIQNITKNYY